MTLIVLAAPVATIAQAASPAATPATQPTKIEKTIGELVDAFTATRRGEVGASIVDLRTGKTVYAHNATLPFCPASNQKLLTSAFALLQLGKDFKFTTAVYRVGQNLVVIGQADPLLGDPVLAARRKRCVYAELDAWAAAVRQKVGAKIAGDLIVCSRMATTSLHPPDWKKRHRAIWYGAPIADLNFHNNCFDVIFVKRDGKILPQVTPASRFIRVMDNTRRGKRHIWRLRSAGGDAAVTVSGTVASPSSDPLSAPAQDPPMLLGRVFADRLARAGITIGGEIRRASPKDINLTAAKPLATTKTPLADAMTRANKRSLNMAAESIFLRAGDYTWAGSAEKMRQSLIKTFGLDSRAILVSDGGGLSRKNRISPENMTKVLAGMLSRPGGEGETLLASLPRNGVDGTMRKRLRAKPYRGRVAAKTGYLSGVVCLSGYVLDPDGKPAWAFSILIRKVRNVTAAKQLQDNICILLMGTTGTNKTGTGEQQEPGTGKNKNR
ncbi:MAG: D-alanyl-D-alanine carboxypeptidase/D-alanyl-D-alanine-endopeptidase [Phycisphaerae bacterium]|nr:D-alanyl-D-alanine carboxypeptidase/D-alanyl-D-alanine-endopeptidase [Phycisphaerae bacterium]